MVSKRANFCIVSAIVLCILTPSTFAWPAVGDDDEPIFLEPQFDRVNITTYLLNDRLLKFQLKCVIFDGPCDAVGHWIKPRVKAALLGECLKCTQTQATYMQTLMTILTDYFPEIHRAAVAKYINGQGIKISEEDQKLIQKINSNSGWAELKGRLKLVLEDVKNGKISTPSI